MAATIVGAAVILAGVVSCGVSLAFSSAETKPESAKLAIKINDNTFFIFIDRDC